MRPLKLEMQGFESYKNNTVIDFEKLGETGLYRITGDTGAGKTTIFDAITFALYGEASGENRKMADLRYTGLEQSEKCFVDLVFSVGDKKYEAYRELGIDKYEKVSQKKVKLAFFDGKDPIEKERDMNIEIQNVILKLSKDDFSKIEMIAQGDFQKFLLAETKDKVNIFRKLFHTEKFKDLQETLKIKTKELDDKKEKEGGKLETLLNEISADESDSESLKVLEDLRATCLFTDEDLEFLKKLVKTDEKKNLELSKKQEANLKAKTECENKLEKAQEKTDLEISIAKTKEEKEKALKESAVFEKNLEEAKERKSEQAQLIAKKGNLEKQLQDYKKVTDAENELDELNGSLKKSEAEKSFVSEKIESCGEKLLQQKEELKKLEKAGENKKDFESKLKDAVEIKSGLTEIEKEFKDFNSLQIKTESEKAAVEKATALWKVSSGKYTECEALFVSQQAGILAEGLEEGKPCPVCGAIHHLKLAVKSVETLTHDELKELKEKTEQLENKMHEAAESCKVLNVKLTGSKENLLKQLKKFFEGAEIENGPELVKTELSETEKKISELKNMIAVEEKNIALKESLEKSIPELEKLLEESKKKVSELEAQISGLEAKFSEKTKNLEELKKSLEFDSENAAKARISALEKEIHRIDEDIENADKALKACHQKIDTAAGKIEADEKRLESYEDYDLEALKTQAEGLRLKIEETARETSIVNKRLGNNESSVRQIVSLVPGFRETCSKYDTVWGLSKIANGDRGNENVDGRVDLETFIQMQYLDRVLVYANQRLEIMSDGIYDLVRSTKGNKQALGGLALDVYDHNECRQRGVESLSGGEKFQASLSLALGLADEITNSGSGIKLESMFIDEGFATLDPVSLQKVMKTLNSLSKSNRLIGIISHVGDLDGQIPKTIDVKKDPKMRISSAVVNVEN